MTADLLRCNSAVAVLGTGSALPNNRFSTRELLDRVSPHLTARLRRRAEKMAQKLAIDTRYLSRSMTLAKEEPLLADSAPSLGARAVQAALLSRGLGVEDIGLLMGHTTTPHTLLPSNAAWMAERLRFSGPHMELRQACTGFAPAAICAAALVGSGVRSVAIAGTEVGSVMLDLTQLTEDAAQLVNLMQMGDGAGAVVLGPLRNVKHSRLETLFYGSLSGTHAPAISLPRGGSGSPALEAHGVTHFHHDYRAIRDHGARLLKAGLDAAETLGIERGHVDWWLPQPVNGRMAEVCAETLGLPPERVIVEAGVIGNVGSAAMWIALDRMRRSGQLRPGDRVLALGAEASKFMFGGFLYVHADDDFVP